MKEKLILSFLIFLFIIIINACNNTRLVNSKSAYSDVKYTVYKIDSIHNYYLIYAKRRDSLYKIVSKKEAYPKCENIRLNKAYVFLLSSIWHTDIMIGGVNVSPSVTPHVTCWGFDDSTKICLERDSINDLFYAHNVKGLCITKE